MLKRFHSVFICALTASILLSWLGSYSLPAGLIWISIFPAFDLAMLAFSFATLLWANYTGHLSHLALVAFIAATLLFVSRNAPEIEGITSSNGKSGALKVLTLNVNQFQNNQESAKSIAEYIKNADPDVVCLQEFGLYYKCPDVASVAANFSAVRSMKDICS